MMLLRIRKHLTYTNVAVTLALVFAMSGGAYAATKIVITSTKQISPKVLKALRGQTGPAGAPGTQGPAGAPGAAGPAGGVGSVGLQGAEGKTGNTGAPGKEGKEGVPGKEGKEGQPWTAGGTLPVNSTETGTWVIRETASAEGELRMTAVSFPIPLATPPKVTTFVKAGEATPPECKGEVVKPGAESGHFCVFAGETLFHKGGLNFAAVTNPAGDFDAGVAGAQLIFTTVEPAKAGEEVSAEGTWAVTG